MELYSIKGNELKNVELNSFKKEREIQDLVEKNTEILKGEVVEVSTEIELNITNDIPSKNDDEDEGDEEDSTNRARTQSAGEQSKDDDDESYEKGLLTLTSCRRGTFPVN